MKKILFVLLVLVGISFGYSLSPEIKEDSTKIKIWSMEKDSVGEGQKHSMQLLNVIYNNCNYSFELASADYLGDIIIVTFLTVVNYDYVCIQSISPNGPNVTIRPLKQGKYKVKIKELVDPYVYGFDKSEIPSFYSLRDVGILKVGKEIERDTLIYKQILPLIEVQKNIKYAYIDIYTIDGTKIVSEFLESKADLGEIEKGLEKGLYLYRIITNDGNINYKKYIN